MGKAQITKALELEEGSEIASLKLKLNELLFIHDAADKAAAVGAGKTDREADEGLTDEVDKHAKERK